MWDEDGEESDQRDKAGAVSVKGHLDLDRAVALERMEGNGKGKERKGKVAALPGQAKAMGSEERAREARRGVGHGDAGRAATVARDSGGGGSGGAGRREGDSGGVRGSCFVWVSGWWFRISTWTFLRSSKAFMFFFFVCFCCLLFVLLD